MGLVDIEFVVFRHPDPSAAAFMRDYGLVEASRDALLQWGPDFPGL